jgi:hypothetical protein
MKRLSPCSVAWKKQRSAPEGLGRSLRVNVVPLSRHTLSSEICKFLESHPEFSMEACVRNRDRSSICQGFDLAIPLGDPAPS